MIRLKMTTFICILLTLSSFRLAIANENEAQIDSPSGKFKRALESNEDIGKTSKQLATKDPEIEQLASTLEVDYNIAESYKTIHNPFEPQLPVVKVDKPISNPMPTNDIPAPTEAPTPQFKISGLVWNTQAPTAIINGSIVKVGDQVSNWAITEISKEGVRLKSESRELTIKPIVNPTANNTNP